MNRETVLMNQIMAALAGTCRLFRINVGKFRTKDGRIISTGVPAGFSDLFGVRISDGRAVFIEVKTDTGKPTARQKKFLAAMRKVNALAGIARSVEEAIEIVKGDGGE